jgi:hypothetical protein
MCEVLVLQYLLISMFCEYGTHAEIVIFVLVIKSYEVLKLGQAR